MRLLIHTSLVIIAAVSIVGCSGLHSTGVPIIAPANSKVWVMQSDGTNVLKITAPNDAKCTALNGSLHFSTPKYEVEFWLVSDAHTVAEGINHIGPQIVSEFKDFKSTLTTDLTIAGAPAQQLHGTGHEADDGDPGEADVIVFKAGDHVFIALNHDESLTAAGVQALLTLSQTAQLP